MIALAVVKALMTGKETKFIRKPAKEERNMTKLNISTDLDLGKMHKKRCLNNCEKL